MADPPDGDGADVLRVALRESEESLAAFKAKTKNYVQKLKDQVTHPGVELRANLKSISHRCHLFEVAFVWELTK